MDVAAAQQEVRSIYIGGFVGQFVSAAVWFVSVALTLWISPRAGILALVFGGMFIFPITQLVLGALGRPVSLSAGNPLRELAIEIAFLVPLLLPLVGAATIHRVQWFYPSMMIVVGAHYLPFSFLYGMRAFILLSAIMLSAGLLIGLYVPGLAIWGGGLAGVLLLSFAFIGRRIALRNLV